MKDDRNYNRVTHGGPRRDPSTLRIVKVKASSVPYGPDISRNGRTVWVALDGDRLVAVGSTASEARRKFRKVHDRESDRRDQVEQ